MHVKDHQEALQKDMYYMCICVDMCICVYNVHIYICHICRKVCDVEDLETLIFW